MSLLDQSPTGTIALSKTIAALQYQYGLTESRIEEYMQIPRSLGRFEIDNEKDIIMKIMESTN
jgi:hypothetical protein